MNSKPASETAPAPWRIISNPQRYVNIRDADDKIVLRGLTHDLATQIVQAVNAFGPMREALEAIALAAGEKGRE